MATHSFPSTYGGALTMVLNDPLTRAALTNGAQRYRGFWTGVSGAGSSSDDGEGRAEGEWGS